MQVIETSYNWGSALIPRSLTSHLIIHHAAGEGSAEAIHKYHLSLGWSGIAYHYYIRKDGSVYRGRPEEMRGGHTTNWNWCSIGICFEGNFENAQMSEAQKKAGAGLVADIISRYPAIVVGKHSEFGATSCPGSLFPYDEIVSAIATEPANDAEETEEPDAWAKEACDWAVGAGFIRGDGNGVYRWRNSVSRQELALILNRYNSVR